MNSQSSEGGSSYIVDGDTIKGKIASEYGPDFFSTDKNTARILLIQYRDATLKQSADWITLFAIIIALLSPFITANFKDFAGIKSFYWMIVFGAGLVLCGIRIFTLVLSTIFFYRDTDIELVIESLRRGNTTVKTHSILHLIFEKIDEKLHPPW